MSLPVRFKKIVPGFRAALTQSEIKYDSLEWGGKRMRDSGLSREQGVEHSLCLRRNEGHVIRNGLVRKHEQCDSAVSSFVRGFHQALPLRACHECCTEDMTSLSP